MTAAAGLELGPTHVSLRTAADRSTDVPARLVAIAPALDATSGRRAVLLELAAPVRELAVGQSLEVEIQAGAPRLGIVLPATAIVDDAGTSVVYIQVEGETLRRREVQIVARAGELRLVTGLSPGERVVTIGGTAVRRSSLVSVGVGEGHVH